MNKIYLLILIFLPLSAFSECADGFTRAQAMHYLFPNGAKIKANQCSSGYLKPKLPPVEGQEWKFLTEHADLSLGAGKSVFTGNLSLLTPEYVMYAHYAEMQLDHNMQMTSVTLSQDVEWITDYSRMLTYSVFFDPINRQAEACSPVFMLYPKSGSYPWGWAKKVAIDTSNRMSLHDVQITTCRPDNMVWHYKTAQVNWDDDKQILELDNAALYLYKKKVVSMGNITFVDGVQSTGWMLPTLAHYDEDGLQIGRPYRLSSVPVIHDLTPFIVSRGGLGLEYASRYNATDNVQVAVLKGMYRWDIDPNDRLVGYYAGEKTILDDIRLRWQLLRASDGSFARQIPSFLQFTPQVNQDLTSFLSLDKFSTHNTYYQLAAQLQQRFTGDKNSAEIYGLPKFDVVPLVFSVSQNTQGWIRQFQIDNLRTLSDIEFSYPEVQRFLGYLGYANNVTKQWRWQLGSWFKSRHLKGEMLFGAVPERSFIVPNLDIERSLWHTENSRFDLSYHYTRYVDQDSEPLFTTKNWQWPGPPLSNYLISMDRIFDRNMLQAFYRKSDFSGRSGLDFSGYHFVSLSTRGVTITPSGEEDPIVAYPSAISSFLLRDDSSGVETNLLYNWSLGEIPAGMLKVPFYKGSVYLGQGPGEVLYLSGNYAMPREKTLALAYPLQLSDQWFNEFDVRFNQQLDKVLLFKNTLTYKDCCWEGSLFMRYRHVLDVYDSNTTPLSDNFSFGLKVNLHVF